MDQTRTPLLDRIRKGKEGTNPPTTPPTQPVREPEWLRRSKEGKQFLEGVAK